MNHFPTLQCACLLFIVSCGDDDSSAPQSVRTVTAAGTTASSDSSGSGSDPRVSGGSDASAPADMYPPVLCGSSTCKSFPGVPVLPPCCKDAARSSCGKQSSTGSCVVPPPPDARCPAVGNWSGCCTVNGMCGADVSVFGFGCEELGDEMLRKFNPSAPTPRRCDGAPPLFDLDAGVSSDDAARDLHWGGPPRMTTYLRSLCITAG